jgi:hypothetical protein
MPSDADPRVHLRLRSSGGQKWVLDSLILPHVNTECIQLFLDEFGARHSNDEIVMVLDGSG